MWYAVESLQGLVRVGVKDTGILLLLLLFVMLGMEFTVSCMLGKCYIPEPQPQYGQYFKWEVVVCPQASCKEPDNV